MRKRHVLTSSDFFLLPVVLLNNHYVSNHREHFTAPLSNIYSKESLSFVYYQLHQRIIEINYEHINNQATIVVEEVV